LIDVKLGAENKKQIIVMTVLLTILLAIGIYDFVSSGNTSAAPPVPASSTTTSAPVATPGIKGRKGTAQTAQNNLDPTLHMNVLEASRRVKYEPGRNIFRMEEAPIPVPDKNVRQAATPIPTPTPTPPPPPIPLKFYGFQNKANPDQKQIFLAENDVVFVAKQGDIIDRRYRVVSIQKTSVTIEDVLTNNKQDIQLRTQQ
jgi:hypothetical protein